MFSLGWEMSERGKKKAKPNKKSPKPKSSIPNYACRGNAEIQSMELAITDYPKEYITLIWKWPDPHVSRRETAIGKDFLFLFFRTQAASNFLSKDWAMKMTFRFASFSHLDSACRKWEKEWTQKFTQNINIWEKRDWSCRLMVYPSLSRLQWIKN